MFNNKQCLCDRHLKKQSFDLFQCMGISNQFPNSILQRANEVYNSSYQAYTYITINDDNYNDNNSNKNPLFGYLPS